MFLKDSFQLVLNSRRKIHMSAICTLNKHTHTQNTTPTRNKQKNKQTNRTKALNTLHFRKHSSCVCASFIILIFLVENWWAFFHVPLISCACLDVAVELECPYDPGSCVAGTPVPVGLTMVKWSPGEGWDESVHTASWQAWDRDISMF